MEKPDKNWTPFFIAAAIALVAVAYYVMSGRGSYDKNVRELTNGDAIENVDSSDPKKITVKCKNGESYEIVFKQDHQSYDELIFNACGPEGTQQ